MPNLDDEDSGKGADGGMLLPSEKVAFERSEMVACTACGKANPPNRTGCLYCGAALEMPKDRLHELRLNLRKLENWENGFNVVQTAPAAGVDPSAVARLLKLDATATFTAEHPFPLARMESEREAAIAAERLSEMGLMVKVVSDVELKVGKPNVRLRSIGFTEDSLLLKSFNTDEERVLPADAIDLIVVGRLLESATESVETGKKEKRKVLAETAVSSDDWLIDMYSADREPGWRVTTKGFDFSGLGAAKGMIAAENIKRILAKLVEMAPGARLNDEYPRVMSALSNAWDIERRTDHGGLKRAGLWKSGFSSVARTSNLEQFTKYSRLQRILL